MLNRRVAHAQTIRRVLLLLPGAFGVIGGIQMYNRLLIKAFSELTEERGGRCDVLILNDPPGSFEQRYATTATTSRSFAGSRIRFVVSAIATARSSRPDLIVLGHVHLASLALALRFVTPGTLQWFITYGIDVWKRLRPHFRYALGKADKILSISDYTRRELISRNELSAENCEVLPCALDPFWVESYGAQARAARFPDHPVLLSCARLDVADRYKGIDTVIRALPRIVAAHPELQYLVIGEGNDRSYLERVASESGVSEHVRFSGRVSQSELARAYSECSLFIMPSRKEGFGIVFLEAAFFGKPSVAGNHGGSPEVVDDHVGWCVEYGDVERLAATVLEALERSAVLRTKGMAARQRLHEDFTWEAFVSRLRALVGNAGEGRISAAAM
ncbi:MAG TPA: glycosyltransferase family 4 protein [Gemmatimonadaceae bacterium]